MAERPEVSKKGLSADWLVRGLLARLGDTVDKFTGRRWVPSSSVATSELVERIKKLLDAEAKDVPGKGTVVPHNIKLRMQWDKFSTDSETALEALQNELLIAAVDHINDSLYYTYAPVTMEVKPDYFIEGVKLMVSFEQFTEEDRDVEMNVTMPAISVASVLETLDNPEPQAAGPEYIARFELNGLDKEVTLRFSAGQSCSVGRASGNDLVLDDSSVSKTHASLALGAENTLTVADTGSTNGTFLNDERIAYGKAITVTEGDQIRFGTIAVGFEFVPGTAAAEGADAALSDQAIEIDGFEFRGREGPERADGPTDDKAEQEPMTVATKVAEMAPAVSSQSEPNITVAHDSEGNEQVEIDNKAENSE